MNTAFIARSLDPFIFSEIDQDADFRLSEPERRNGSHGCQSFVLPPFLCLTYTIRYIIRVQFVLLLRISFLLLRHHHRIFFMERPPLMGNINSSPGSRFPVLYLQPKCRCNSHQFCPLLINFL